MIQLPPLKAHGVEIEEIESKRAELNVNRRALRQAEVALAQLENQRPQAESEDILAAVVARRKGEKDPGNKRQDRLEKQMQAAQRDVDVLKGLQTQLESEAWEQMREHSTEIIQALNDNLADLNTRQLEAIAQLEATRSERRGALRTLEMVGGFVPPEVPEAEGPGQDYIELSLHHTRDSVFRMDDQAIARVLAQLRGEAGHREELQAIAEQEQGTMDVFFPGTASMAQPEGYKHFVQRKAERAGG